MNCGLANLDTLKTLLLAEGLRVRDEYDTQLAALGRGVAAAIEQACNRQLAYATGAVFECTADRSYVALPRFPLVSLAEVAVRASATGAWVSQGAIDAVCQSISNSSGLVEFGGVQGSYLQRLRVTYTGGFFFETLEPTDEDYPTEVPEDAAELPADLRHAWVLQCQAEIMATRLLDGQAAAVPQDGTGVVKATGMSLPERVQQMLKPFVRYP